MRAVALVVTGFGLACGSDESSHDQQTDGLQIATTRWFGLAEGWLVSDIRFLAHVGR